MSKLKNDTVLIIHPSLN